MAHLLLGTFRAVAGVFRTKGYLMDQTSNHGMRGYEAYKEERKQKQLAAALRQQEAVQQLMQQQQAMQQQPEMQQAPQQLMQQQQAPQGRTSGLGLIKDLKRKQLPYGEVYRRPR